MRNEFGIGKVVAAVALCCMFQFAPAPAFADVGIPSIVAIWPISWLLLFIVIPLEAKIAQKIIGVPYHKALEMSGRANFVSTLAGVPITWLLLLGVELAVGSGITSTSGSSHHEITTMDWVYRSLLEGPIIVPGFAPTWFIPLTLFMMNFPFCLMSVYVERKATEKFIDEVCTKELLRKWAWIANLASYAVIDSLIVIITTFGYFVKK